MPRRFPHLLAFLVCMLSCATLAAGQQIRPQAHPNHYLIVVDASGSTVNPENKRKLYESTLREKLASYLYEKGFGPLVPPYDPSVDRLSLVHFGIVPNGSAKRSSQLSDYSFSRDFIHGVFARTVGVDAEAFKQAVVSHQHYQNTILTWARQLALESTQPGDENEVNHRTFVIFVHDGKPNDNSVFAEIDMVRRDSTIDYNRVNPIIERIDLKYRFTNGEGKRVPAFSEEINNGSSYTRLFIEAYEVVSTADEEFMQKGKMAPLAELRWRSLDQTGDLPRATLAARITSEFEEWTRSAKRVDFSLLSPPDQHINAGLEMPVTFSHALTCSPDDFKVLFRASLARSDRLLGTRTLDYESVQTIRGPVPTRCTQVFLWSAIFLALAVLALLAACGYYVRHRWFATHLSIQIPGTMKPLRLERSGTCEGYVPMTPQRELEACSLRLPHRFIQRIFYRNARITLISAEQIARWGGIDGPTELNLPFAKAQLVPAVWRELPQTDVQIEVHLRQGSRTSSVFLKYPRALAEEIKGRVQMDEKIEVYVSLDLGSESMAAYYEERYGDRGDMIQLQTYGPYLYDGDRGAETNVLLQDGNKTSPRLWNRISLKERAQPHEPGDDHAVLEFIGSPYDEKKAPHLVQPDEYKKSLFRFFHVTGDWPPKEHVLPNPKILFQQQVVDVLKRLSVAANDGTSVDLKSDMLVKHLTVQVIKNFLLSSPQLQAYSPEQIHLTLTVPNVYSLPHAKSIKEFVIHSLPRLGKVKVLSESDAVAYYALRGIVAKRDSSDLQRFKENWQRELKAADKLCIVTLDVGKGTTDLSCILVENPPKPKWFAGLFPKTPPEKTDKRRRHSVQAQTGKSTGGNYLSHIFARYYEECLNEAFANGKFGEGKPPFGFIRQAVSHAPVQREVVSHLERLIGQVKSSMTEDLRIESAPPDEAEIVGTIVDRIITALFQTEKRTPEEEQELSQFRADLINKLTFPLLPPQQRTGLRQKLFHRSSEGTVAQTSIALECLLDKIEKYLKANVDDLFGSLEALVKEHQAFKSEGVDIDQSAFVIISGQASQFRPLRAAVDRVCKQKFGIDVDNHVLRISGVEAKLACAKGAVNFWKDNMRVVNAEELHGTYGCLSFSDGQFFPFNMKNIKGGGSDSVTVDIETLHYIVFTPRPLVDFDEEPPKMTDGATALLTMFEDSSEFTLNYDPDTLTLRVNGTSISPSSFGSVDSSISEMVWPEILERPQEGAP
jgi:hypothetical protein